MRSSISRMVTILTVTLLVAAGMLFGGVPSAAAGEVGTVATEGAPLFVHLNDHTVIDWMSAGTPVDILWAQDGMVEIRYNGTDGWAWAEDVATGSSGAVGGSYTDVPVAAATSGGEHWIDVNRNSGQVTLYIGDEAQAVYWGSLSYDSSDGGFYTTASGTFYVYSMVEPLSYTPFADNYITDWVGYDSDRRNGFHSWTRDASGEVISGGSGATAGCVGLEPWAADQLFAFAFIGMRVEVHN